MNTKSLLLALEDEIKFVVEEQARILTDVERLDDRLGALQDAADSLRSEILCRMPEL